MPSGIRSAFENTSAASTCVAGTWFANAWIAASIVLAFAAQSLQQLWNSVRRRTTSRDSAGWSRLILVFTAAYASSTSLEAKNGDCAAAAVDVWQREQYCSTSGCTVVANSAGDAGKLLLAPGSMIGGALSTTPVVPPPAVAPAQAVIHVVRMSAQASLLASQQLWPPATFWTMRESRGDASVTIPLAAA